MRSTLLKKEPIILACQAFDFFSETDLVLQANFLKDCALEKNFKVEIISANLNIRKTFSS